MGASHVPMRASWWVLYVSVSSSVPVSCNIWVNTPMFTSGSTVCSGGGGSTAEVIMLTAVEMTGAFETELLST